MSEEIKIDCYERQGRPIKEIMENFYHGSMDVLNNQIEKDLESGELEKQSNDDGTFDMIWNTVEPRVKWFQPPFSIKIFKWEINMMWAYKLKRSVLFKNCYPTSMSSSFDTSIDNVSDEDVKNMMEEQAKNAPEAPKSFVLNFSATPLDNPDISMHANNLKKVFENMKSEEENKQKVSDFIKAYNEYIKGHPLADDWDGDYIYDESIHAFRAPKYPDEKGDLIKFNTECDLLEGNKPENDSDKQYDSCSECHRFDICRDYYSKTAEERWFDSYVKMMISHNEYEWQIGWESLPKYIGHKIYNTHTKEIAIVNWDSGFPELYDKDNNKVDCFANDFRHGNGYWIYKVGENYNEDDNELPNYFKDHLMSRFIKEN